MIAFTPVMAAAAAAPAATLRELAGRGDILVLVPHPDDESLAMGGAIAAAADSGRRVTVAIVTDGARSHPNSTSHPGPALAALRRQEVERAVAILTCGRAQPIWLGYPDLAAPDDATAFALIEDRLEMALHRATAIWTTWDGDPHPDHQRVFRLGRHLASRWPALKFYSCPVWGRVQTPVAGAGIDGLRRFDTADFRDLKRRAVAAHVSQMTDLIDDDPAGFRMPAELAAHFVTADEIFIP